MNGGSIRRKLIATALFVWTSQQMLSTVYGADSVAKPALLKGSVNSFGILTEELQSDLGFKAVRDADNKIRVDKVRLGTEAYYRGLQEKDRILSAKADGTHISIGIERDGHNYTVQLKALKAGQQLTSGTSQTNLSSGISKQKLSGNVDETKSTKVLVGKTSDIHLLADYKFEIIMDRSLSMREKDCPGGLSRWEWCGAQTTGIAKDLSPYVKSGLTLVPFNHGFDVFDNASPENIVDIFNDRSFILGTRLCEPLTFLLDRHFKDRKPDSKPLLIVVITDGEPWPNPEPEDVRNELVKASTQMVDGNDVIVVFLQIGGNDKHGRDYLVDLGGNLVSEGAKYQYVHTVTFEDLEASGLAAAIISTVEQYGAIHPTTKSASTPQPKAVPKNTRATKP